MRERAPLTDARSDKNVAAFTCLERFPPSLVCDQPGPLPWTRVHRKKTVEKIVSWKIRCYLSACADRIIAICCSNLGDTLMAVVVWATEWVYFLFPPFLSYSDKHFSFLLFFYFLLLTFFVFICVQTTLQTSSGDKLKKKAVSCERCCHGRSWMDNYFRVNGVYLLPLLFYMGRLKDLLIWSRPSAQIENCMCGRVTVRDVYLCPPTH